SLLLSGGAALLGGGAGRARVRLLPAATRCARRIGDSRRSLLRHALLLQLLVLLLVFDARSLPGHRSLLRRLSPGVFPCSERPNVTSSALRSHSWNRAKNPGNQSAGKLPGPSMMSSTANRCSGSRGGSQSSG